MSSISSEPRTPSDAQGTTEPLDLSNLKKRTIRGGTVTFAAQGLQTIIQLSSTVILARLLDPSDFGTVAMVTAITAFAALFRDLGLSAAAIQRKELTLEQQSSLFWINVLTGSVLTVLVAAMAPLVAWFFEKPELRLVTLALSLNFVIGSLGTQHGAMLTRRMEFGRKASAGIVGGIVGLAVAVAIAWNRPSYWALVWSTLAGSLCTTMVLSLLSSFRPGFPAFRGEVRELINFGANVTAFDLVNYFHRNLDNVLIGRVWGEEVLGLYSRAYALLMLPIHSIRRPINTVAYPALSKLQGDPDSYRSYLRRTISVVAFASMPLTAFLFLCSRPLIHFVLGDQWMGVVPIFAILAIAAFIQPVASLRGLVMLSMGHGGKYLQWGILNAVCVVIGFAIGVPWGAVGVATGYVAVNYLLLYPSLLLAFSGTDLSPTDFFAPLMYPAIAALGGLVISFTVSSFWAEESVFGELLLLALTYFGSVGSILCLLPGARSEIQSFIRLAAHLRGDKASTPSV